MSLEARKQLKRREHPSQCRFLTFSCRHRLPLLGSPAIRDDFVATMTKTAERTGTELIAWVVMPEHVHLVVAPSVENRMPITRFLATLKRTHAKRVIGRWKSNQAPILDRIRDPDGRVRYWQPGGGYDRNVRDHEELHAVVDYTHHNPVKRGLVDRTTDWRWSSAQRHMTEPVPVRAG